MKKYRFFYHYYRQYNCMSLHFKGKCYKTDNVICKVDSETKWNKTQPNLVIRGFVSNINITNNFIEINNG